MSIFKMSEDKKEIKNINYPQRQTFFPKIIQLSR